MKEYNMMNEWIRAFKALLLFKKYTTMPRWMEVSYGIMAWILIIGVSYYWID